MRFRRHPDQATTDGPAVAAVFAGVLDGRRLWVAVDARPGRLALRSPDGLLDLPSEGADGQPGYLSARLDLVSLTGAASYDVVLVDDAVRPVSTGPLSPQRVPAAPGGLLRHVLVRAEDGALGLRTDELDPSVELETIELTTDGFRLAAGGTVLALGDEALSASWSLVRVGPHRLPVRRRDDDLLDPGRGAPLPSDGALRLRWSGDGLLQARGVDER